MTFLLAKSLRYGTPVVVTTQFSKTACLDRYFNVIKFLDSAKLKGYIADGGPVSGLT